MSKIEVNTIDSQCGSALQIGCTNTATIGLGKSGDTITVPCGATIVNSGTATGFGATGETSWDTTVKTTGTFTATAGVGYFLNTTGGIITVNLAAGTAGDSVALADYAGTWQTNNVTVNANGSEKIGGVDAAATLSTQGQSVTFVYIDGTQGWVNVIDSTSNVRGITPFIHATGGTPCTGAICGDCKVHTFTGPGTFCVSSISPSAPENVVSYLVVAGGGGGGEERGGGGGAGGFREYESPVTPYTSSPLDGSPTGAGSGTAITVAASPYAITVGGGGSGATAPGSAAPNGNSSIFSTITSAGGGGGGSHPPACNTGSAGGSGGGLIARCHPGTAGGLGNTPPTTPSQGFPAGAGTGCSGRFYASSGGGATAAGSDTSGTVTGTGGAGATTCISASPVAYAGGGGGGANCGPAQPGGAGGGGSGGFGCTVSTAGGCNTGGGGGGGPGSHPSDLCGSGGGSGIVIIRYKFQ